MSRQGDVLTLGYARALELHTRSLRHRAELLQELHLVEVEMLRRDLATFHAPDERVRQCDLAPTRRDLALRRPEGAGVSAGQDAFAGDEGAALHVILPCDGRVGQRLPESVEDVGLLLSAQPHPT